MATVDTATIRKLAGESPEPMTLGRGVVLLLCDAAEERDGLRARAEKAEREARDCNGSCDIALARRQVGPDGNVLGNARECAHLWEREASRLDAKVDECRAELRRVMDNDAALLKMVNDERDGLRAEIARLTTENENLYNKADMAQDAAAQATRERDELRASLTELERTAKELAESATVILVDTGGEHDEDCPCDDTCDCEESIPWKRMDAAVSAVEAALNAMPATPVAAPALPRCRADRCTNAATHGLDGEPMVCWQHAGDWPRAVRWRHTGCGAEVVRVAAPASCSTCGGFERFEDVTKGAADGR